MCVCVCVHTYIFIIFISIYFYFLLCRSYIIHLYFYTIINIFLNDINNNIKFLRIIAFFRKFDKILSDLLHILNRLWKDKKSQNRNGTIRVQEKRANNNSTCGKSSYDAPRRRRRGITWRFPSGVKFLPFSSIFFCNIDAIFCSSFHFLFCKTGIKNYIVRNM